MYSKFPREPTSRSLLELDPSLFLFFSGKRLAPETRTLALGDFWVFCLTRFLFSSQSIVQWLMNPVNINSLLR